MLRVLIWLMASILSLSAGEILDLAIVSYEKLIAGDEEALEIVDRALHEKGIVGVRGIPGYREKYARFVAAAREFTSLPEEIKEQYKPNRALGDTFLGYENGGEKFPLPNGEWVVDNLKVSYYARIPDNARNKWPVEVNVREPFEDLGQLMADVGEILMYRIGILGEETGIYLEDEGARLGRMLYYRTGAQYQHPYWCGAHFDHGLFTAILPAVYFSEGKQIPEPEEAGLFVRPSEGESFKKVAVDDLDVMMFQVAEFGQIVTNDEIRATEHRVHKAEGAIERYTMAVFFAPPMDLPVCSTSMLTNDPRYGAGPGEPSTFRIWNDASFRRYLVQEDEPPLPEKLCASKPEDI